MNNSIHWLLTYLLNAIWQVPLIAATAIVAARLMSLASWQARHRLFIAAIVLAALLPAWSATTSGPKPGESIAVSILPGSMDAATTTPAAHYSRSPHRFTTALHLNKPASRIIATLYIAFLLYGVGMLFWKWRATQRLLKQALPAEISTELNLQWQRWKQLCHVDAVHLFVSDQIAGPVTLGSRRAALLVPPNFLSIASREEVAAALCHELAHIARHDFFVNLLLEIFSLPIAFYPACWLLKKYINESRELACDALAANISTSSEIYARSLLSLAQTICAAAAAPFSNALGIFEANSTDDILEKRIMNLIDRKPASTRAVRLVSATVGGSLLATTCIGISAFILQPASAQSAADLQQFVGAWKTTVNGQPAATVQILSYQGKLTGSVSNGDFDVDETHNNAIIGWRDGTPGGAPIVEASVSSQTLAFKTLDGSGTVSWNLALTGSDKAELRIAEAMPNGTMLPAIKAERVAPSAKAEILDNAATPQSTGDTPPHAITTANPEYTREARAQKISGDCLVGLTIDEKGMPTNVRIIKSLDKGLDENAIKAVKQYRFTPATHDGVPVSKDVKIEVAFRIY